MQSWVWQDFTTYIRTTHADNELAPPLVRRFARHGASPRGVLSLVLAAKAFAVFDGRLNVSFDDLRQAAIPALRHRILLNFEGEAEGAGTDRLIEEILATLPLQD